ncbi:cytochrome D1 domain-containing protein [Steroidobacter sp.]|uniref:cytochrome D1 domain-containing protein n=1 Tax=Steroidobacter sp. TaxID=1978227 RepID=UPI001A561041|nr:cytochrome D1 domain-containing protein [Steroidobacter sp.]MBL8265549.1 beta-propeller fold lactonase family protein [Steroidobacter sp.]
MKYMFAPVLLALSFAAAAVAAPSGTLLVLNKSDDTVSFIDLASNQVKATLPTGDAPHEVAVSGDGKTAVVANYGDSANPGKTLTVIDVPGQQVLRTIDLGAYSRPHGIVWLQGDEVAVTVEASKALLIVGVTEGKVKQAVATDQVGSHMVAVSPKHRRAFTANIGSGSTTVIDLATNKRITDVVTGKGAEGIAVSPDGSEVWVTNRDANTVSIVDPQTLKITATLQPGEIPIRVKFTPDGTRALVSNAKSGDVAVFDTATKKKLASIPMQKDGEKLTNGEARPLVSQFGTGPVPVGILIPDALSLAFVANTNADTITVIDLNSLQIVNRLKAGREPDGLGYTSLSIK